MIATRVEHTQHVPIDERPPATVRAIILARESAGPDVATQVKRCGEFIAARGWTLVADPNQFAELNTSGLKKRPRPVLAAALALAQQRAIDVIVASEYERLDRNSDRRAVWKHAAERFGVEFRFANLPPTGKLPDTMESRIIGAVRDVMGEVEAERLRERTLPGLRRRAEAGLPGSGRSGPPYGYCWRPKQPGEKAYCAYELVPEKAARVQAWYDRLDRDETVTMRQIARELHDAGVPTPSGKRHWSPATLAYILKNPLYCGRARLLRYHIDWEKRPDEHGELWDERLVTDRLRDADAWESETLPLADGVIPQPYLVSVDVWQRVQERIVTLRSQGGRAGRHADEYPADATLLHGGFAVCAHCGARMPRFWHKAPRAERRAYYRCGAKSSNPATACPTPSIAAQKLDRLVLSVIAAVMADPQTLCDWADANEAHMSQATQEVALADATLDALRARIDELTRDATRYQRVLDALDSAKDAEEITLYRDKLAVVTASRESAQAELNTALPKRDHAQQREWLLRALRYWSQNLAQQEKDSALVPSSPMTLRTIGDTLLLTPDATAIYRALEAMPYTLKRRLLRDLAVTAVVSRPRSREERKLHGWTPLAERVTVRVGALEVHVLQDSPDVKNGKGFWNLNEG